MKIDLEAAKIEMQNDIEESKKAIFDLIEHNEMLDDDGYPTEAALDVVRLLNRGVVISCLKFN